jgi:hypothetical protein
MGLFEIGNRQGSGRPKGSKNKLVKEDIYKLVNMVISDLNTNYDKLTTNQKLRLLHTFKGVIEDDLNDFDISQNYNIQLLSIDPLDMLE